ncbi:sensor histidine kinase [uncultured Eubacterium sp.]|uniref:sensor histidine kinase n=1 Tax=uncultured Eubacterium sp. TaxID=165185 RepID=UPI0026712EB2|nr:sensor histidine kinase [uncultured Eubacterium sp.]
MKKIVDNLILFIICAIVTVALSDFVGAVIFILSALSIISAIIYVDNPKIWFGILCGYVLFCIKWPMFFLFLPVILYHGIWYQKYYTYLVLIVFIPFISGFELWSCVVMLFTLILSALLAYYSSHLEILENKLIVLRDTSKERDMLLREKNKELLEKQDYEVYLATLKERNRIAREIHDNVGHMLTRSILQVGALKTIYKEEPLQSQLESVNDTLNLAMTSIRKSVHNLHDDAVDLKQVIADATKEMSEKYDLRLEYDMSNTIPKSVKYCFIATIKEAMSNIAKHSNADKISIILREHPGFYQLCVEDNGTIKKSNDSGIGLINMRERVEQIGGNINIKNENGFEIFIIIKK